MIQQPWRSIVLLRLALVLTALLTLSACGTSTDEAIPPTADAPSRIRTAEAPSHRVAYAFGKQGLQAELEIVFPEPMDREATAAAIRIDGPTDRGDVRWSTEWTDDTTLYLRSTDRLEPNATYTVSIDPDVLAADGEKAEPAPIDVTTPPLTLEDLIRISREASDVRTGLEALEGSGFTVSFEHATAVASDGIYQLSLPVIDRPILLQVGLEGDQVVTASLTRYEGQRYAVCHVPPGNPASAHTIHIDYPALAPHLGQHGDRFGPCPTDGPYEFATAYLSVGAVTLGHYDTAGQPVVTARGFSRGTATLDALFTLDQDAELATAIAPGTANLITPMKDVECLPGECPDTGGGSGEDGSDEDDGENGGTDGSDGGIEGPGDDPDDDGGAEDPEDERPDTCTAALEGYDDTIAILIGQRDVLNEELADLQAPYAGMHTQLDEANSALAGAQGLLAELQRRQTNARTTAAIAQLAADTAVEAMNTEWREADRMRDGTGAGCLIGVHAGVLFGGAPGALIGCAGVVRGAVRQEAQFRESIENLEDANETLSRAAGALQEANEAVADQLEVVADLTEARDDLQTEVGKLLEQIRGVEESIDGLRDQIDDLQVARDAYERENCE